MNEIRRHDREADEIARIREIVGRHALPDFVTGFDVRLGEYDGDPAAWIVFQTVGDLPSKSSEAERWISEVNALTPAVREAVIDAGVEHFPFFRFQPPEGMKTTQQ